MSTPRVIGVAAAIVALSACNPFRQQAPVQVSTTDASLNTRWHANLASPATLSGAVQMSGSASMAPAANGAGTVVLLELANASPGGVHPWEARLGQCGSESQGTLFGTRSEYTPIEVGRNGEASGTASVALRTPMTGQFHVVVHASAANPETVVACGNLAPPTG